MKKPYTKPTITVFHSASVVDTLRQAFRNYVEDDAAEHGRNVTLEEVDRVIDSEVEKVVAQKTNAGFVAELMCAVQPNTEVQIHCEKHGEVMAYTPGNHDLHCPQCYNTSLGKIEDMAFKQHVDKCFELMQKSFSVGGAKKGVAGEVTKIELGSSPLREWQKLALQLYLEHRGARGRDDWEDLMDESARRLTEAGLLKEKL